MTEFTHQPARKSSNLKKWLLPILGVIIVAVIAFVTVSLISNHDKGDATDAPKNKQRTAMVNGYAVKYASSWYPINIGKEDQNNGVVVKLAQKKPQASFVWRILSGEVSKDVKVADLPSRIQASLSKEVSGFKLVNSGMTKVGEFDAAQVQYKQNGVDKKVKQVYENKMFVIPRTDNTYYLTIGAKDGELSQVEPAATKIIDNLKGYIASHP